MDEFIIKIKVLDEIKIYNLNYSKNCMEEMAVILYMYDCLKILKSKCIR